MLFAVGALVGFVVVFSTQLHPPDPESRLPSQYRLTALIQRQQKDNEQQKDEVQALRQQIQDAHSGADDQKADVRELSAKVQQAGLAAGSVSMTGTGFTVTLNDSTLASSPTGNVNDLVIHSQDVQAVVNAMWGAGAEAVVINDQRVVSTSAVLCVGNTLLINGTVHSPPYEISAIGPDRSTFNNDPLVRQLRQDADRFSLRFAVGGERNVDVPAYTGPTVPRYAQAAG